MNAATVPVSNRGIVHAADGSGEPAAAMGRQGWLASGAMLALSLAYVLWFALSTRDYFVDDAYIGFTYVRNLLEGNGLVFNPPDRVEGITNTGWVLALAPLSAILPIPVAAKLAGFLGLAAAVVAAWLLACRLRRSNDDVLFYLGVPLLVATQSDLLYFSLAGMETAVMAAALCALPLMATSSRLERRVPLVGAGLFLLHPEALLVFPLAILLSAASRTCSRRHLAEGLLTYAVLIALITVARLAYFGSLLPNTFQSKPTDIYVILAGVSALLGGSSVNVPAPFDGLYGVLIVAAGGAAITRAHPGLGVYTLAIVSTGLGFSVYARPDWTGLARYFAPYLPIALLLLWRGTTDLVQLIPWGGYRSRVKGLLTVLLLFIIVLIGALPVLSVVRPGEAESYPAYVLTSRNLVGPSLWMRDNLKPGAVIATRRIGAVSYYSGKRIFDYKYGLTERKVARLVAARGATFDDPNDPLLASAWLDVRPDYLLEDEDVVEGIASRAGGTPEGFQIHGLLYRKTAGFPIGAGAEWVLCERVRGEAP